MGGMKLISNDIWWRHTFQCNQALRVTPANYVQPRQEKKSIQVKNEDIFQG